MSVELHLPDLPEVPISLGPATGRRRVRVPWHVRLREVLSAYLPIVLMLVLALGTWWLVRHTPVATAPPAQRPVSSEPDYTMRQFALERFDADGRLKLRIEGSRLNHYPDTDRIEIDDAQIRAIAPDGRVTLATAKRALGSGDGSEIQLLGGVEVTGTDAAGTPLAVHSEFLHAFLVFERLRTDRPVRVRFGANEVSAGGLEYDHAKQRLDLKPPMRATLLPPGARP